MTQAKGSGSTQNALADMIGADIDANGGKLIVDPEKFERMRMELAERGIPKRH